MFKRFLIISNQVSIGKPKMPMSISVSRLNINYSIKILDSFIVFLKL